VQASREDLLREVPLYTPAAAARFTGASQIDVRRWVEGYSFRGKWQDPVSEPARRAADGTIYLTFHHLIEVWTIRRMRQGPDGSKGLSLQAVREAAQAARELFQTSFPLADERLAWDGAGIFYDIAGAEAVDAGLVELSRHKGQYTWSEFIRDGLKRIQYRNHQAIRLWPLGRDRLVVLDPSIRNGWPTLARGGRSIGIPADVVAEMVEAGDSPSEVAASYEVEARAVADALAFVETWSGKAA
jgi:uncharacterized protein (DUF433 family)